MLVPRGCVFPMAVILFFAMIYEMFAGRVHIGEGLCVMGVCVIAALTSL